MSIVGGFVEPGGDVLGVRPPRGSRAYEQELATELLEVQSEEELDRFLGRIASDMWARTQKGYQNSPAAQQVMQKAKKFVPPVVGGGLGALTHSPRDVSQVLTQGVRQGLDWVDAKLWGAELEAVSPAEAALEMARRYVRFAQHAIGSALQAPRDIPPAQAAQIALVNAARRHAPALVPRVASGSPRTTAMIPEHGRWARRGRVLVVDLA